MNYKINRNAVAPGSISTGTLKEEDLIRTFSTEIKRLSTARPAIVFEAECWLEGPQSFADNGFTEAFPNDTIEDTYEAVSGSIVHDLVEHLNGMACSGLYFGVHWGDAADFGWWECNEEEE